MIESKHIALGLGVLAVGTALYKGSRAANFADQIEVDIDVTTQVGLSGVTYLLTVNIYNPTSESMDIATPSANIRVKGSNKYFAYSKPFSRKVTIAPKGKTAFPMVLESKWSDLVFAGSDLIREILTTGIVAVVVDTKTPVSLLGKFVEVSESEEYSYQLPDGVVLILRNLIG